ncbi:tubulin polyglutamylase TTLL4 isoform X3 [Chelonia mydas]|uniref:tubulin polyglutamylase TTLL4 isoform X3 n=1 Tax=Chelonia mydas TaxID=8469 RepID=UPI0018A1F597|nr:tubulin polyglutamylase TTLL4 isoform X3 [Chelonia mydas]
MASAGPEHYSIGLKRGSNFQLPVPAAERSPESQAWFLAQQQVKPIWKLGRKHVNTFQDHRPIHSGIPPQRACFLYPASLCSSHLSDRSLPLSRSPPHPFPDLAGSTLLYRRSYLRHKPYQRLESICLRSSVLESRQLPFPPSALQADLGMASSAVDPFPRPSAAGEQPGSGGKSAPLGSGRQTSSQYKPVLNNNSFLRPNSAKVPLLQSPENKKLKTPPRSPAISWSHCGGNGDGSSMSLENSSGKGNGLALEHATPMSRLSPVQPSAALRAERTSLHLEDSESRVQTLKAKEREIRLTEAVRKLSGKVNTYNKFGRRIETSCLVNTGFQYNLFNRNSHWKQHLLTQLSPKETAAPLNLEMGNRCLSGNLSLAGPDGAAVCTKRISVRLLASNSDSSDPSAPCRTVNFLALSSGDQVGKSEPARHADISAVAAQMSTIQLSKDAKWEQAAPLRDPEAAVNLPLLDPGEPEADAEEELPDGLEDGCSQDEEEEEGESDSSSVTGLSPNGSVALISRNCIECLTQPLEAQERILKPALICSLFPTVPPTIYFSTRDEKVEKLPWEQRKLLRWKMSTVTPNIVKQTIGRSHFKVSKKSSDWLGCWGHHMKSPGFRAIKEHQKLNHFPGSFQIGRKDRLWRNLSKMQARFGKKEFNFFPQSFILPQDIKLLRKAWEESGSRQKWIVKPPASARGIGIQVIHKWSQLPKRRPLLVQRYSSSMKSLSNKFMHLTNYSVNKKNAEYKSNSDETACQGHKWALKALWSYLSQKGVNSEAIWEKIKDIVIKTIIASEPYVNSLVRMYVRHPYCCHELFGFDVMLDENLKPWILEVNISPSLHSNSPLDVSIKGQMIRDLLNLAGFVLPNLDDVASGSGSASSSAISLSSTTKEKLKSAPEQFTAEKMKRAYYLTQKLPDQDFYSSILDILTPDDVRVLVETEDEFSRRGQFERAFPTRIAMRYLRFFEQPRYFNILTAQWELKYYLNKPRGLDLLRNWCHKGYLSGAVTDLAQTGNSAITILLPSQWSLPRPHLFPKSDGHLNGFCKLESGQFSKPLPRDAEEVPKSPEPSACPQSLPLIRYAGGAIKNPVLPRTQSHLSDSALVM